MLIVYCKSHCLFHHRRESKDANYEDFQPREYDPTESTVHGKEVSVADLNQIDYFPFYIALC